MTTWRRKAARRIVGCLALVGLLAAPACSGASSPGGSAADGVARASAPEPSSGGAPSPVAGTTPADDPVSLPALVAKSYDGRALRTGRVLARTAAYTRSAVTYRSGRLTISGVMDVPTGKGPFPVLILAHGYIDPSVYTSGRGLKREQDYLARHGYVVLHVDYRNHAQSDDDRTAELNLRLGYTEDVINAVEAVKRSSLPYLDHRRVGLLGRSMGGGVVLNALVVRPNLVDAAVVFASVSSNTVDNFDRWIRGDPARRDLTRRIVAAHGSPERAPAFWRAVSPVTYFDRVRVPLLMHQGSADKSCPPRWSRTTYTALRRQGKDATLFSYPGEPHAFGAAWPLAMRRTVDFLDRRLRR